MEVEINPGPDVQLSDALRERVHQRMEHLVTHFTGSLTRVEIYLKDVNGPKGGADKHCVMEAHAAGLPPLAARCQTNDLYDAIKVAADRLEKVLQKQAGKHTARTRES